MPCPIARCLAQRGATTAAAVFVALVVLLFRPTSAFYLSARPGQAPQQESSVVIKNYRPLPPAHDEPLDRRCALLHLSARKAWKHGRADVARSFYGLYVYKWRGSQSDACIAHTYVLWALLEQHVKNYQAARTIFQEATSRYPTHARLLQAWALMESKLGRLEEARRLIQEAVQYDGSLAPVLKWKLWSAGVAVATCER